MKNDVSKFISLFLGIMLLMLLWRPLVWLLLIVMAILLVMGLRIVFKSSQIKKEMEQDTERYFQQYEQQTSKQDVSSADVIDVEYTEKEVSIDE